MVLDSSALVAIQLGEAGHVQLLEKIRSAAIAVVGAPTVTEAAIVLINRTGPTAGLLLDGVLRGFGIEVIPFGPEHYSAATSAFLRYGKGRHPAGLNYGDCMSYAMSSVSGLPLLYVGRDFSKTDIKAA
jgi:ribonuclease VapC